MKMAELSREQQAILKRILKKAHGTSPARKVYPLVEEERYGGYDNEYWSEYGFLKGTDLTDEEIAEQVHEMTRRNCTPYDCTGKPVTVWIDTHRNPCGLVSYVHRMVLDV